MDGGRNDSKIWEIRNNSGKNLQNMVVLNSSFNGLANLIPSTYPILHQPTVVGQNLKRKADHFSCDTRSKIICQSPSPANNTLVNSSNDVTGVTRNGNMNVNYKTHLLKAYLPQSQPGKITQTFKLSNSLHSLATPPQQYILKNVEENKTNFVPNQPLNKLSSYQSYTPSKVNAARDLSIQNQYILVQTSIGPTLIPISQVKSKVFVNNHIVTSNVETKKYQNNALQNLSLLASLQTQPNKNEVLKCSNSLTPQQNLLSQIKLIPSATFNQTKTCASTNINTLRQDTVLKPLPIINDSQIRTSSHISNYHFSSSHASLLGKSHVQSPFVNNYHFPPNTRQVSVPQSCNLPKINPYSEQLIKEYKMLSNPKFDECCTQDAIHMLLPYHVYYTQESLLPDSNEYVLCDLFKTLEHKKSTLFQKYHKLYLDNSTKDNKTLENIMIDRLWLSSEKETLAHEKQICETQGPDKLMEYLKQQSITRSPHPTTPLPVVDSNNNNIKAAPNILGSLIKNAIFDEDITTKSGHDLEENDRVNLPHPLTNNFFVPPGEKLLQNTLHVTSTHLPQIGVVGTEKELNKNIEVTFNSSDSLYHENEYNNDSRPLLADIYDEPNDNFPQSSDLALEEAVNSILY